MVDPMKISWFTKNGASVLQQCTEVLRSMMWCQPKLPKTASASHPLSPLQVNKSLKFNLINVPLPWAKRRRSLLRHAWSCLIEFYGACYQRMGPNLWRITSHEFIKSHASQITNLPTLLARFTCTELRFGTGRQSPAGGEGEHSLSLFLQLDSAWVAG